MYISQNSVKQLTKMCKVLFATLFISLIWQPLHAQELSAGSTTKPIEVAFQTSVPATNPEELRSQKLKEAYNTAKFLTIVDTTEKIIYTQKELLCLAKNIYYEAGRENSLGKIAVAQVTINRTKHPKFPNTICGVVLDPHQFDWVRNKRTRTATLTGVAWDDSLRVAKETLEGKRVKGIETALFFHNTLVHPQWRNVSLVAKIGTQLFYEIA